MDSECRCTIELRVLDDGPLALQVLDEPGASWSSSEYVPMVTTELPDYEGPYEATPTRSTQVLSTSGRAMTQDFTVNPIPSNYGLIEWNGSVLRVS